MALHASAANSALILLLTGGHNVWYPKGRAAPFQDELRAATRGHPGPPFLGPGGLGAELRTRPGLGRWVSTCYRSMRTCVGSLSVHTRSWVWGSRLLFQC